MYVVVYMFAAEAVVAFTAGAVTKLKIRIVHIGLAADCALMIIELTLLLVSDAGRLLAEVDGALALFPGQKSLQVIAAENEEVEQGHQRQEIYREGIAQHADNKEHRVNKSEKLHAHRDNEHEQHLHIRIHRREGEEHRKIDVAGIQHHAGVECKIHHKAVNHRQQNTGEKEHGEGTAAPFPLKDAAYPVIEVKHQQRQKTGVGREEHEADNTPDLTAHDKCRVKDNVLQEHGIDHIHQPEGHIGYGHIFHKIAYAKVGVIIAKALNFISEIKHCKSPEFNM